jgi:hypothetical protein
MGYLDLLSLPEVHNFMNILKDLIKSTDDAELQAMWKRDIKRIKEHIKKLEIADTLLKL